MNPVLELREDQVNFIVDSSWTCPECKHDDVKLYVHPHRFAGIYECQADDCGASWECLHEDTETETVEDPPMHGDQTVVYYSDVTTCLLCGSGVDS